MNARYVLQKTVAPSQRHVCLVTPNKPTGAKAGRIPIGISRGDCREGHICERRQMGVGGRDKVKRKGATRQG